MSEIVGACLSQYHDDADSFELLLAFADGREIGHLVKRTAARNIAAEFSREFGDTPPPVHISVGLPQDVINLVIAAREFWEQAMDESDESAALDAALEAFSSRVPYANEPDALEDQP